MLVGLRLAPALTATRLDVLSILKNESSTSTAAPGPRRLRRGLLVAQIALSLTLLIVAGLFLQSLRRTLRMDPGFDPRGLAIVSFDTSLLRYTRDQRAVLTARYLEQVSEIPGVTSAAAADVLPLGGVRYGATLHAGTAASVRASVAQVSPSYFETLDRHHSRASTAVAVHPESDAVPHLAGPDPPAVRRVIEIVSDRYRQRHTLADSAAKSA